MNKSTKIILLLIIQLCLVQIISGNDNCVKSRVNALIQDCLDSTWGEGNHEWSQSSPWRIEKIKENSELNLSINKKPLGSTLVNLDVWYDSKLMYRIPLSIKVKAFATVPVSREKIKKHTPIEHGLIEWRREEVSKVNADWPENRIELTDNLYRAKRNIRSNQLITWQMLEKKPVINRGSIVQLVSKAGNVTIYTDGIALENAFIGNRIKVENPLSGKQLYGIVKTDKSVLVETLVKQSRR